ncbi:F-box/kelch-repeat protein [Pyrus ussuriensis x Pyrus communis]|uniref:F-box/kelch-repeat protein n=1 Tax=Pyrus ussuriensis x Pyrus communis TaxID=2448454 RepID=A0A5N5FG57_9ROSA|nr:F-box/kelch-repeat protein [Pyrus ussuriensis x Pyrus communis]
MGVWGGEGGGGDEGYDGGDGEVEEDELRHVRAEAADFRHLLGGLNRVKQN